MEIFQKFDTNKDGNLSREEIKQGLRSLKLPHSEDTIDLLLKTLDANQDGQVTFEVMQRPVYCVVVNSSELSEQLLLLLLF
jgi:Ca2+-binding EF-hand superfamily protein